MISLSSAAKAAGLRYRFIFDEPLTANASTTGMMPEEVLAPSKGIQEALAQTTYFVPVSGWLRNVLSPVEGINPWSSFDAFLRDTKRTLRNGGVVIAHTVWLQAGPSSAKELAAIYGPHWYMRPAREFLLQSGPAGRDGESFTDAKTAYQVRAKWLLPRVLDWAGDLAEQSEAAVIIIADHGQTFIESSQPGIHYSGIHGFYIDEPTF